MAGRQRRSSDDARTWERRWKDVEAAVWLREHLGFGLGRKHTAAAKAALSAKLGGPRVAPVNTIYAWAVGFRRPGEPMRDLLEATIGCRAAWWLTPEERAKRAALARRTRAARAA